MIGQLLEAIDLGCQSGSVIIVLTRHFDQIYTTCALFMNMKAHAHACVHTLLLTFVNHKLTFRLMSLLDRLGLEQVGAKVYVITVLSSIQSNLGLQLGTPVQETEGLIKGV